ncbi:serine/threonine-protein kinase, partial [Catenulispora rubra]|uniref:serine/threonine-protein kinase n=1 Tax=Catenulispora rubra TaxID=280293 RepID=UPI001892781B
MAQYAPGQLIDRYQLANLIARGGMGEVWKAWDNELHVDVALKRVNLADPDATADDWAEAVARARVEARIGARLRRHPNVVTVFDVVTEADGMPWLVMDYVEGRTLLDQLKTNGPLHEDEAAKIAGAMLDALQAAHAAGIMHRDIKPGNVLLGVEGSVFLSDFGIAKRLTDTSMTVTGKILASFEYAAPERIEPTLGDPDGTAADLFSLGVTLYEAVEGISPFRQDPPSFLTTINAICTKPHPPMTRAKRLAPLINQLLAKNPADRPGIDEARTLLVGKGQDRTEKAEPQPPPPP